MPRYYKRISDRPKYDEETKDTALKAIQKCDNVEQVSREMKIPPTTLKRWRANPSIRLGSGGPTVLNESEENLLVEAILYTAKCGFSQGRNEVKDMVESYIRNTGRKTPFKDGRPGNEWIRSLKEDIGMY